MRKIWISFVSTLIVTAMLTMNAFAMPYNPNDYTSVNVESEFLPSEIKRSQVTESAKRRGDFFISADLIIKDNGNGDVGAFAKAYMAVPVDEAYITVYLDRWDKAADRWRQVTYYDAEFYAKDFPEGISDPSIDVTFKDQEKGYYYRVRGVFAAVRGYDFEGFSPTTAGILIE